MTSDMRKTWRAIRRSSVYVRPACSGCAGVSFIVVMTCLCAMLGVMNAAWADPPCLFMSRGMDTVVYIPGQLLEVEITLENSCVQTISSLGISESLPEEWEFVSGEVVSGDPPAQWPAAGSTGSLEIFWIDVPVFPVILRYTVQVPETASGVAAFSGYALYYYSAGGEQHSNTAQTTMVPYTETEPNMPLVAIPFLVILAVAGAVALKVG